MTDRSPLCRELEASLEDVLAGHSSARRLSEHAAACAPCTALLSRQRSLEGLLRALPAAPAHDVPLPSLEGVAPEGRPRRGLLLRPARFAGAAVAAAAALLLAVVYGGGTGTWTSSGESAMLDGGTPVRIERVVTVRSAPLLDDDLLALTAGVEVVAARRPTEAR